MATIERLSRDPLAACPRKAATKSNALLAHYRLRMPDLNPTPSGALPAFIPPTAPAAR